MPLKTTRTTVCVCVSNLPDETCEADIKSLFAPYAAIQGVRLFSGESFRRSQGFGYIDLSSEEVERVVSALDGQLFNGSILRVREASAVEFALQVSRHRHSGKEQCQEDERSSRLLLPRYEVTSVEKVAVPAPGQGSDWYRYVLSSGKAEITGFHRGTLEEVTAYASSCAVDFNLRTATGKSTRTLAYVAQSKKR